MLEIQKKRRVIVLLSDIVLAALLIIFDRFTKQLAIAHLKGKPGIVIIDKVFRLEYLQNTGSAFGMFSGKKSFLCIIAGLFVLLLLYFLTRLPVQKRFLWLHFAIAAVIAGGLGNMLDRIMYGYVVDFFYFNLINFPIFNVADIYIVLATILLVILFLFVYKEDELQLFSKKKVQNTENK